MTVIESDSTMLVRLTESDIIALLRALDGRSLSESQQESLNDMYSRWASFDAEAIPNEPEI